MASEAHGAGLGAMYRACLQRETDGSYGVMLSADAEMTVLVILDFRGSHAVQRWNQKHPQCPILVGHVVVEANGATSAGEFCSNASVRTRWIC